ncbi:MAG TPA: cupin domain-containing protein [Vicinamibacterales bacterium]|nr:cupin domain-containing protein [Vicinamibacterales bacterium]
MAQAGTVAENPVTGERMVFLRTAADTHGQLLRFDHFLKIGGFGPNEHIHPLQEEHFHVVEGRMGVVLDGQEHILEEGSDIAIPPGARHTWWNAGDIELHQITEFRPARSFEVFAETLAALGREEGIYKGLRLTLQFAVLSSSCPDNVYVTKPPVPVWVQKLAYPILARIAALFGYRRRYLQYALPEPGSSARSPHAATGPLAGGARPSGPGVREPADRLAERTHGGR